MEILKDWPKVLVQKILFTALIGAACFIVGLAIFIFSKDKVTLALSVMVLLFCIIRSAGLYITAKKGRYETVEGTCVGVSSKPLRKQITIRIMDDAGCESTLRLGKQTKVKLGFRYRFYFKQGERVSTGSVYFDAALSSDSFLGFEDLGEFAERSRDIGSE